jgi:dihydroorotase
MATIPREAEEMIIARDLALVRLTGARYHVQHVSTAGAMELVAAAKAEGLPVTAEATPHHLSFDHSYVEEANPVYKMMPPLRELSDVEAIRQAVRDGIIDVVGTDHAPHAAHEKDVPWEEAPFGVIGLEWAGAVVNTMVGLDPEAFFRVLSGTPANLVGLEHHGRLAVGRDANIVVFAPNQAADTSRTVSMAPNSPYLGMELRGRVIHTMLRGRLTVRDGEVATPAGAAG